MGAMLAEQRFHTTEPGRDYMTRFEVWLSIQRG